MSECDINNRQLGFFTCRLCVNLIMHSHLPTVVAVVGRKAKLLVCFSIYFTQLLICAGSVGSGESAMRESRKFCQRGSNSLMARH